MASEQDIRELPNGSQFYRADLHIHSHGASHDVADATMSPQAIVQTAIEQNLHVIAIADHNEIVNVQPAIAAADQTPLYVVPAIELSTLQGHLLCYLPTFDALQSFFGRLSLADRGMPTSRCQTAMLECLQLLEDLKGFGVLAHVDAPSGYEAENPATRPTSATCCVTGLCWQSNLRVPLRSCRMLIPIRMETGPTPAGSASADSTINQKMRSADVIRAQQQKLVKLRRHQSLAIIAKTQKQAEKLHLQLAEAGVEARLLQSSSAGFSTGLIVCTAHLAKGLEFDRVIVPDASARTYHTDMDRNLLYVACTRAMHRLTIVAVGAPSDLLPASFTH